MTSGDTVHAMTPEENVSTRDQVRRGIPAAFPHGPPCTRKRQLELALRFSALIPQGDRRCLKPTASHRFSVQPPSPGSSTTTGSPGAGTGKGALTNVGMFRNNFLHVHCQLNLIFSPLKRKKEKARVPLRGETRTTGGVVSEEAGVAPPEFSIPTGWA